MTPTASVSTTDFLANPTTLNEKPREQTNAGLDPRAVRYGFLPVKDATGLPVSSTSVTTIKGAQVFPFAPFEYALSNPVEEELETITRWRLPADQIHAMQQAYEAAGFTELTALAYLSRDEVRAVLQAVISREPCVKYAAELGNTCATCRLNYARSLAPKAISEAFANNAHLAAAALTTLKELIASLETGIGIARSEWQKATRDILDPKKKPFFIDNDYRNMRHIHAVEPARALESAQVENANLQMAGMERMGEILADKLSFALQPRAEAASLPPQTLNDAERAELEAFRASRSASQNVPVDKSEVKETPKMPERGQGGKFLKSNG